MSWISPTPRKLSLEEMVHVPEATRSRVTVVCTVRGEAGGVDEKLLAQAFATAVGRHPSLRSRIRQDGPVAYSFQPLESGLPELQVRPGGPSALAEEINTALPPGGALVRAVLLRGEDGEVGGDGEDGDTFVLSVDHTITDGQSALALNHSLWRAYAALADGTFTAPEAAGQDLPAPLSARLTPYPQEDLAAYVAARGAQVHGVSMGFLPYAAAGRERTGQGPLMDVARVRLTVEETARLVGAAKAGGVSVHGLVVAALLIAIRQQLGGQPADRRLGSMTPVDLRSRLSPPLDGEVLVPAASFFFDVLDVPDDADPVALGRRVVDNLRAAMERGDLAREILAAPQVLRDPSLMRASLVTTNLGSMPVPGLPSGLEITDMRCFALGNASFPQAGRGPLGAAVLTVHGRLGIEFPHSTDCFTPEQLRDACDSVRATLTGLAS
ncbi:phthiocerol/phthiodiolone dimycocerosyl transferase family protein [Streptomyces sp. GS7]|uniref:phthiocerol/phthiodiolone dimycocerosyl transferase family protein n=1 Tax=Streptomyces sp. GS7 TaxID=2692234 RepID=UPI0013190853|nr:hypothetical protein [Streptomyces sp. GS7]QHC20448.1 hypothetical protein GR130_02360 [Streptomyces sp. GS7]